MELIPSLPTLWYMKDGFVTKILKDQHNWKKWGASCICFVIRNIDLPFSVNLVNARGDTMNIPFKVKVWQNESGYLGVNKKTFEFNGPCSIPNKEKKRVIKVYVEENFTEEKMYQKFADAVFKEENFEISDWLDNLNVQEHE